MAITNAVLVNDGGAPARIINFLASEAIAAGKVCEIITSATGPKVQMHDNPNSAVAGYALTDAASGDMCSVVTGSGVILNVHVDGGTADVAIGDDLEVGTAGALVKAGTTIASDGVDTLREVCAVALEANTETAAAGLTAGALFKVLVL